MYTDQEALSLVQHLSPGESVQWWEAPALLDHHLEGTATHGLSSPGHGAGIEQGFRFLILKYENQLSVILKSEDWKALIRQLETLTKFHVALGATSTLPLQQSMEFVQNVPFEGTYWAILPLDVWKTLFQKLEACYRPTEWKALTEGLEWLRGH